MSVFRTYFSSCLALAVFSCATVQAEKFEFTLHDFQIKKDLAAFGLNLDEEWKALFDESGNYEEDSRSELSQKIVKAFSSVTIEPPTVEIPSTDQGFSSILHALNYKPLSKSNDNHTTNSKNFNRLLEGEHLDRVINLEDDQVNKTVLFQEIVAGICTYISAEAIAARLDADKNSTVRNLHIYIKLIFDTDEKTITLKTTPNAAQDGFVRTYSEEDVEKWLEEDEQQDLDPKPIPLNSLPQRSKKTRSCCGRFTKLATLSMVVLGLGVLANSYMNGTLPEMVDTETLTTYAEELGVTGYVEQLTEYFGNLTVTQ